MLDPKERANVTVGSLVRINVSKKSDSSNLIIDYVEEVLDDYEFNQNGTKVKGRDTGKVGNTVEMHRVKQVARPDFNTRRDHSSRPRCE